jgi:hypothetical protein
MHLRPGCATRSVSISAFAIGGGVWRPLNYFCAITLREFQAQFSFTQTGAPASDNTERIRGSLRQRSFRRTRALLRPCEAEILSPGASTRPSAPRSSSSRRNPRQTVARSQAPKAAGLARRRICRSHGVWAQLDVEMRR